MGKIRQKRKQFIKQRNILRNNVSKKPRFKWVEEDRVTSEVGQNVIHQNDIDNNMCEECGYVGQHSNNCIKVE